MTPKKDVSKVRKERKKTSKKDAGKPKVKRALTPYFMFAQENREKVKLEFGFENRQLGDIAKKLGEKWKNLSDEEKAHYVKLSEDDKKRYEREKKELEAREESSS